MSLLAHPSWNTFRDEVSVNPVEKRCFDIYKYPLPVNMAVDENKLESRDKNVNLLSKNTYNI